MPMNRRQFLLSRLQRRRTVRPRRAAAEAYPSRPVRMLVGFPAGGPPILARMIGDRMQDRLGHRS